MQYRYVWESVADGQGIAMTAYEGGLEGQVAEACLSHSKIFPEPSRAGLLVQLGAGWVPGLPHPRSPGSLLS